MTLIQFKTANPASISGKDRWGETTLQNWYEGRWSDDRAQETTIFEFEDGWIEVAKISGENVTFKVHLNNGQTYKYQN